MFKEYAAVKKQFIRACPCFYFLTQVTTELMDARSWHRNEVRTIAAVSDVSASYGGTVTKITLTEAQGCFAYYKAHS